MILTLNKMPKLSSKSTPKSPLQPASQSQPEPAGQSQPETTAARASHNQPESATTSQSQPAESQSQSEPASRKPQPAGAIQVDVQRSWTCICYSSVRGKKRSQNQKAIKRTLPHIYILVDPLPGVETDGSLVCQFTGLLIEWFPGLPF